MRGHIRLGAVGALRDYMLVDYRQYLESTANQMAAQIGGGAGDYNDLQSWGAWVQDDWRAGNGKTDAEGGGFLFSTSETRYPNQMLLPRHLHLEMMDAGNAYALDASTVTGETTIGTGQTKQKWAMRIGGGSGQSLTSLWIYLKNNGETYTVRLSGDTASAPGTSITTTTVTSSSTRPGYGWYKVASISQNITSANYWISLEVASTGTLPVVAGDHATPTSKYHNGSSWVSTTDYFGLLMNPLAYDDAVPNGNAQITEFNDELYATGYGVSIAGLQKRTASAPGWGANITGAPSANQILDVGGVLYLLDNDGASKQMDAAESITALAPGFASDEVTCGAMWNGYVWLAKNNEVVYTADGTTFSTLIEVASNAGVKITGLAGLGDYLYVATTHGLLYVGFGDQVRGVTVWGSPTATMGKGMLHYQGALYIPTQEALLRWDGSNMLPMGIDLGEGLPDELQGNVAALTANNNWLFMGIDPRGVSDASSIWAYNGQGWHAIATLPPAMQITCLYYRRSNQRLYVGTEPGLIFSLYLPDVAGLVDSTEPEFAPVSWLETDWWYGGLREVRKDIESVYILAEEMGANQTIKVYWQDDESTTWELLGTATADRQEIRWSNYNTRPNTRGLRLGFLLQTNDPASSPVLRAVRLKYHAMVTDWDRWRLPIQISDQQMMFDGDINIYDARQQRAHLKALKQQVPPVILQNIDDTQYEVKIVDASFQLDKYEWIEADATASISGVYHITVEQVTQGEYSG